jgi:hypothetical protein
VKREEPVDDSLEDALAAAAAAASIVEVDASERDAVQEVDEGMGPRLKSFAVVRAGVASRISDALRIRPHSFS